MNRYITLGVALAAGFGIGGIAVEAIHAQAQPPAYVIAENVVNDQRDIHEISCHLSRKQSKTRAVNFLHEAARHSPCTVR